MNYIHNKPKSFCGVFGIYGNENASIDTYYGLLALQHRGQEACGIVTKTLNEKGHSVFKIHKDEGLVSDVFADEKILASFLKGKSAIGHNRYSTTGSSNSIKNVQPFFVHYKSGNLAIAHNGNFTNAHFLRNKLIEEGAIFQTSSDTEVVLHLIAKSKFDNQIDQIIDACSQLEGAFCLTILLDDKLIAVRDPNGFRPLSIGKKDNAFVVASETCAFDIIQAKFLREVKPGELIVVDDQSIENGEIKSFSFSNKNLSSNSYCIFEYIYFSRPDSFIFGHNVDKMRRRLGKILAKNYPVTDPDGDKVIVISVPDSSNTTALGYQTQLEKMGINSKLEIGLIRSHYIGRTFIQPGQEKRKQGIRIKFNTVKGVLENRTVVVVDDSIVRGNTSKQLIKLIREANPKSIHLRISSAPIKFPCYYGMDFPSKEELIAFQKNGNIPQIQEELEVDSLDYLTIDEMLNAVYEIDKNNFCTACFSGKYPTEINKKFKKEIYETDY